MSASEQYTQLRNAGYSPWDAWTALGTPATMPSGDRALFRAAYSHPFTAAMIASGSNVSDAVNAVAGALEFPISPPAAEPAQRPYWGRPHETSPSSQWTYGG
jgi:hypothetical protein